MGSYSESEGLLKTIPEINSGVAEVLVSEIGVDMS